MVFRNVGKCIIVLHHQNNQEFTNMTKLSKFTLHDTLSIIGYVSWTEWLGRLSWMPPLSRTRNPSTIFAGPSCRRPGVEFWSIQPDNPTESKCACFDAAPLPAFYLADPGSHSMITLLWCFGITTVFVREQTLSSRIQLLL